MIVLYLFNLRLFFFFILFYFQLLFNLFNSIFYFNFLKKKKKIKSTMKLLGISNL